MTCRRVRVGGLATCGVVALSVWLSAQALPTTVPGRIYVTAIGSELVQEGLALAAPVGPERAGFAVVPPPGLRRISNQAFATPAPWVESNAWRFTRGLRRVSYETLPVGSATLAAAEAFVYGADAILNPAGEDLDALGRLLRFLRDYERPPMPALANIGVVDDHSSEMDEILNMLTRRNLLYRIVAEPDSDLDVTVELGSTTFPREAAANPSDFAARVRAAVGDDNRLVRLFGTSAAIAHLTGDEDRARLFLLNFSRNRSPQNQPGVRVRILGRYEPVGFAAFDAESGARLADVEQTDQATEFSLPPFSTVAIVDLTR